MWFYKNRIDRYIELIEKGEVDQALRKMKQFQVHGLKEHSNVAKLFERLRTFQANIEYVIGQLEKNNNKEAVRILNKIKSILPQIKMWAKEVAKEEVELET